MTRFILFINNLVNLNRIHVSGRWSILLSLEEGITLIGFADGPRRVRLMPFMIRRTGKESLDIVISVGFVGLNSTRMMRKYR